MRYLIFALLGSVLTACQWLPTPTTQLTVQAAKQLNPDTQKRSLPVRIRVYQLSQAGAFQDASFEQLWHADTATLGRSLLARQTFSLFPGQKHNVQLMQMPHAHYLAVMALFRQPKSDQWRTVTRTTDWTSSWLRHMRVVVTQHRVQIL